MTSANIGSEPVLDEQRNVLNHNGICGRLVDEGGRALAHEGMDDRVEPLQSLRIGEDDRAKPLTIERPVVLQDLLAEFLDHSRQPWRARLDHLACQLVSVDDDRAVLGKCPRDRALPGADASGETDPQHRAILSPARPPISSIAA